MTHSMKDTRIKLIFALLICFFVGGIIPAFSQQILATAGIGKAWLSQDDYEDDGDLDPWMIEANLLFVGNSGFTVSAGSNIALMPDDQGAYFAPLVGLGYVSYSTLYFGGILNVGATGNVAMIAPTAVAGYDLGLFLAQAQLSYLHSFNPSGLGLSGFRFSVGVGLNLGAGSAYR